MNVVFGTSLCLGAEKWKRFQFSAEKNGYKKMVAAQMCRFQKEINTLVLKIVSISYIKTLLFYQINSVKVATL